MEKPPTKIQKAFDVYEHSFNMLTDSTHNFNFGEAENAHLQLLRAKLDMEIANRLNETMTREIENNEKFGKKVFWLNILIALLTATIAASAIAELVRKII